MVFQESFEILIALYLFLAGVGAGAILSAAAADLYNREMFINYIKAASLLGMPLVAIGCGFLLLDLGQGLSKPWLLIFLFANPASVISWGTAILSLFIVAAFVYALSNFGKFISVSGKWLRVVLIALSVLTAGYTAVLLGSLKAIPFWNQSVLPALFLVSAASTGIAATIILSKILYKGQDQGSTGKFHVYLIIAETVLIAGMLFIGLSGVPEMVFSVKALLSGTFAFQFWLFFVIMGLIIPLTVSVMELKGSHVGVGIVLCAEALTLFGGFFLRYLILHAGTFTDKFAGLM